jgi:hypothetical protein
MADISYGVNITVNKGFLDNRIQVTNVTANMSLEGMQSLTYSLTTNPTTVSTAGLSSVGLAFLRNLSTAAGSTAQIGIEEGEPAVFRLSTGVAYKAIGTAGARLRVDITEG